MKAVTAGQMVHWMVTRSGEVEDSTNATMLAEACAAHFHANDEGGWLDDPDHEVWDAAIEAAEIIEETLSERQR